MKFFPLFIDISDKRILFIGAGKVASRRVLKLMAYKCHITVIAPVCDSEIEKLYRDGMIDYVNESYNEELLENADIVFICTDDKKLNHEIWSKCKRDGILVNNCSDKDECDFYFPSVINYEESTIAINSEGNHSITHMLRKKIEDNL